MTRRIIREEGMFCGGSSGAVLTAAINYAKEKNLDENCRIVVIFADNLRNYITKLIQLKNRFLKLFYCFHPIV